MDVDLEGTGVDSVEDFVKLKTQKLLDYGVEKVILIFTKSKSVVVADGQNWTTTSWENDIEILDGIVFNLAAILKKKASILTQFETLKSPIFTHQFSKK